MDNLPGSELLSNLSTEPKKKALILDPKFILEPLEDAVTQKLENSKEKVINYYEHHRGMNREQCYKYLKQKRWFQMLYNQKDMHNLISIFGIYLTYSDILVVPEHILEAVKASTHTKKSSAKELKNQPFYSLSNFVIFHRDEKLLELNNLKERYKSEIQRERDLLQQITQYKTKLQLIVQATALRQQQDKFLANQRKLSKISTILEFEYESSNPLEDFALKEKLSILKKECDQLEIETDRLIQYPAINYWEEDPNSTLINQIEEFPSLYEYRPHESGSEVNLSMKNNSETNEIFQFESNNNFIKPLGNNSIENPKMNENPINSMLSDNKEYENEGYTDYSNSILHSMDEKVSIEKDDFDFLEESLKNLNKNFLFN